MYQISSTGALIMCKTDKESSRCKNPEEEQKANARALNQPKSIGPKPFRCTQCPCTYKCKYRLKYHMNLHRPDNPHVCPRCGRACSSSFQLRAHLRTHTRVNMKCDFCGKTFNIAENLKIHLLRVHASKKPYPCILCSKQFATSYELKRHIKCHKGFGNSESLRNPRSKLHIQQREECAAKSGQSVAIRDSMANARPEYDSNSYLDSGFRLRRLSIPVQRMTMKTTGDGLLDVVCDKDFWTVCCNCGRGHKSMTAIRHHALQCSVGTIG